MENILKEALNKRDFSEDVMTLAKAATIVRNDVFNHQAFKFAGCFPPQCQEDSHCLFTVGALDNLDHNPSSTTSQSSFHGTGISLFQFPTRSNPGECRPPVAIHPPSGAKEHSLPHSYAFVPAVALTTTYVSVPKLDSIEPTTICLD